MSFSFSDSLLSLPFLLLYSVEAMCPMGMNVELRVNTRGGVVQNEEKEDEKSLCVKNRIYNSLSGYLCILRGGREKMMSLGGHSKYTNDNHFTKFNEIIYK